MDGRSTFPSGTVIEEQGRYYRIEAPAGYGGSAVIYRAMQYQEGETPEQGKKVLLKEIYPAKENGFYWRQADGTVISEHGEALLEEMRGRLQEEERAGEELKDRSFLVCNLKQLEKPHLKGQKTILCGLARMPDMKESAELLADWLDHFEQLYHKRDSRAVHKALELLDGIAESMQKIHQAGYLYCDFSPGNVFVLTDTCIVVFIDLGCVVSCPYQEKVDTENYLPATWGYRAPELCQTGLSGFMRRTLSAAADIYSITAFFYRLFSGADFAGIKNEFERSLCPEKRVISWEKMHQLGITDPVSALLVNDLLLYGLAFEPENRIQDMAIFREKLRNIRESMQKGSLYESLAFIWERGYRWLGDASEETGSRFRRLLTHSFETAVPEAGALSTAVEMLEHNLRELAPVQRQVFILNWLKRWLQRSERKTAEVEFRLHYCAVGIYNYLGACAETIQQYEACMKIASPLDVMLYIALRLRGAENYANFFAYQKAWKIVQKNCELLEERKVCYRHMASQLSLSPEQAGCTEEYGKNLSAAGRYLAFLGAEKQKQGKMTLAKTHFRKSRRYFEAALDEFQNDEKNRRRVCNALLQLATAAGDEELFEQYRTGMQGSGSAEIETQIQCCLDNLQGQNLYDLHALLKGLRVFRPEKPDDRLGSLLMQLTKAVTGKAYATDEHPWELILKEAAILLARYHECIGEEERRLFALAAGRRSEIKAYMEGREEMAFSTLTVLSFAVLAQEKAYEIYYSRSEAQKEALLKEQEALLEGLFRYVRRHKCGILTAKEWDLCEGIKEKYQLVQTKVIYEYD